ncbi:MAG: DNA repair protein RadC [Acidobacteria bacterium]|nr:MAG: DNA repair protein RadC [Acidobacteriota bacterium]
MHTAPQQATIHDQEAARLPGRGGRRPGDGPRSGMPASRSVVGSERPRERLLEHGARTLSDGELITLLVGTGAPGVPARQLAGDVLDHHGGVQGLRHATPESLRRRGLGPAKVAVLLAAGELAVRMVREELPQRTALHRPERAARYLAMRYGSVDQEVMGALYLDVRSRLIEDREVYRGTLNRASVEPRGLLKPALLLGASSLLLFHTHPSGDPTPSAEDLAFTRRMVEAASVVGVQLVDHLVLGGPDRWVSLRSEGAW